MELLKYADFKKLDLVGMAEYINKLCDMKGIRHYFRVIGDKVYDTVFDDDNPMTEIDSEEEMSGLCRDYHTEPTDMQGQIFSDI